MSALNMEFLHLSSEIHIRIISFLPTAEVFTGISRTCKRLHTLCNRSLVWQGKFFKVQSKNQTKIPGPLLCHSAVPYQDDKGNHQMIFYGGNLSSTNIIENVKKDLWCYQFDTKTWSKSSGSHKALTEHTSVVYKNNMYIFGGNGGLVENYSNNILSYPLPFKSENTFTRIETNQTVPPARSGHSAVVYKDSMYIFGGWNGHTSLGDFYAFDFDTQLWRKLESTGSVPAQRRMHCTIVYGDHMYLFGGYDESRPARSDNDIYIYSFKTDSWEIMKCRGPAPCGRSRSAAVVKDNFMYIIGGWDRVSHFEDTYRLDLDKHIWYQEKTNLNMKIAQQSCVVLEDWMIMYGGKTYKDADGQEMAASNDLLITRLGVTPQNMVLSAAIHS
eukprot:TRINITY_DN13223_c0_g1_i1.p1 TRINITY_DN13223_c0_g1~~TRINITY_DN13223_c0_g1_i1.p1  ORF type:complete len:386 (-),score=27.34 TRINITY_DN13223_c0_g1_i1:155-1312(-)